MHFFWSQLLPQLPYLLLGFLLPMGVARMQLGPKARAMLLEDLPRWSATRLFVKGWFWTSDKVMFWLPPMAAVFERWDEIDERAAQTASSAQLSSSRHEHDMRLVRHENVVNAECADCALSVPVKPPRSARRNVVALERWLDRLDARLQRDTPGWP